jgi:hypothetical protein
MSCRKIEGSSEDEYGAAQRPLRLEKSLRTVGFRRISVNRRADDSIAITPRRQRLELLDRIFA